MMRTEVETGPSTVDFRPTEHVEFVLLVIPDANGSLRGKALRPDAFEAAVRHGTVMTDLLLALDPVDVPISDYEKFGIRAGAADLVVHPDTSTLHDLRWRPGWRICLGTPSWPDGSRCEIASREVLRGALLQLRDVGYDAVAAIEYEVRLRAPARARRPGGRSHGGAHGSGTRPHRAQSRRPAGDRFRGQRGVSEVCRQGARPFDGYAGELSRQDRSRRGRVQRPRPPLVLARWSERVCRRRRDAAGHRRSAAAPARGVAPPQPDHQLIQAAGAGLFRPDQRQLGRRKPLVRRARDPLAQA